MRRGLLKAEALETLRVPQHLTPLRGQGDDLTGKHLLSGHADVKDLLGFLPRGNTTQGRQAKRYAIGILRLAHPPKLGHAKKRFDGIGADRYPDVIEPESRGSLELEVKRGAKLLTQCGRGHGGNKRLALGTAVV